VTNFSPDSASIYNVGGGASDSREHLIGQKIWWEAEVQRVMSSKSLIYFGFECKYLLHMDVVIVLEHTSL